MPSLALLSILLIGAYLLGAIPFGYLIARWHGIDILNRGSGNIGATNVGRVMGAKWGTLVFAFDFLKGVLPVFAAKTLVSRDFDFADWQPLPGLAEVGAAVAAFLGHLFPVTLGFRGGKGVATGAGTILVLVPIPALFAFVVFIAVLSASSIVSLSSIAGLLAMLGAYAIQTNGQPVSTLHLVPTLYLTIGSLLVVVKHRSNIGRLWRGTENRLSPSPKREQLGLGIHLLALGWLFGATLFLQFIAGLSVFQTFPEVVANAPSDRTAQVPISNGLDEEQKKQLASALAGAAVGPMFPKYFAWSFAAVVVASIGAAGWREGCRAGKWQFRILVLSTLLVGVNWCLANEVSRWRLERFSSDSLVAANAKAAFGSWHLISLFASLVTGLLSGIALFLAAWFERNPSGAHASATANASNGRVPAEKERPVKAIG